ncbi:hypothetical protein jhhlp_006868 [Lomentospora prolificans]|uniref:RRM domain-containing protein n=1 Tax=Lomentospora prolificans TaxID=41688 RepID=A0A2N3N2Z7_9PEZI|nr:hypothetical protein jhhlp_006868 [Lomentospora prolificans]
MGKPEAKKAKAASDFEKIIHEGRERKRNEQLAASIFSKDRRKSAPSAQKLGAGPSLASRVGVTKMKRTASTSARVPPGNVNAEWTHDLHASVNPPNSLASRVSAPGSKPVKRTAQLASALQRVDASQANVLNAPKGPKAHQQKKKNANAKTGSPAPELSIRGLAGPFSVLAQNFAPGTTAADIESAMTPVGGEMLVCKVLKTHPIMLVEMVFHSREAGEKVINKFNDQMADGRIIKVYANPRGYASDVPETSRRPGPSQVVDGKLGFSESNNSNANASSKPDLIRNSSNGGGKLYSDSLVGSSRRGRGRR